MGPPHWRTWQPVMNLFDGAYEANALEATRLRYRIIADELRAVGIDVNCAPLLDVLVPETHEVIGRRALGTDPAEVARRGQAVCEGLIDGGVLPVIKHIPGHGRAVVDSHHEVPRVNASRETLNETDFAAFVPLAGQPLGMTGHVIYEAIDSENCATHSPAVVELIREQIGFDGLLMTDDLSMQALAGSMEDRTSLALGAGCDMILHCNGDMDEMQAVATLVPELSGVALERAERALSLRSEPRPADIPASAARYEDLTGEVLNG